MADWSWLLEDLGYPLHQSWENGRSWRLGPTYLAFEQSPALTTARHDRCSPGLNHLAFHIESPDRVELLTAKARENGWMLLFPDRHPHAGGDHQHVAHLESRDGFEIELIAPHTA
ncbi:MULTISPECIES: glyoxalase [unclassified Streptomyces]|uniref:glyoxalase n=1 Tax=unclassified Streptomyces TaxID=2593676 RepID=UPI001EF80D31|nr:MULTISPECIES: glyoxalase [unclassified Streptomyces]